MCVGGVNYGHSCFGSWQLMILVPIPPKEAEAARLKGWPRHNTANPQKQNTQKRCRRAFKPLKNLGLSSVCLDGSYNRQAAVTQSLESIQSPSPKITLLLLGCVCVCVFLITQVSFCWANAILLEENL